MILVVGAGLAGLSCALAFHRAGRVTNVASEFAPAGWHLISATILDLRHLAPAQLAYEASQEITEIFAHTRESLSHLETIFVPKALPALSPGFARKSAPPLPAHVLTCGD